MRVSLTWRAAFHWSPLGDEIAKGIGALAAVADVLDGTAPVLGYVTVVEAHLLAGLAHRELGDQYGAAAAWDSLGYARSHLGDYAEAVTCYREAVEWVASAGTRRQVPAASWRSHSARVSSRSAGVMWTMR